MYNAVLNMYEICILITSVICLLKSQKNGRHRTQEHPHIGNILSGFCHWRELLGCELKWLFTTELGRDSESLSILTLLHCLHYATHNRALLVKSSTLTDEGGFSKSHPKGFFSLLGVEPLGSDRKGLGSTKLATQMQALEIGCYLLF